MNFVNCSKQAIEYGTNMVGGVSPGGKEHLCLPLFNSFKEVIIILYLLINSFLILLLIKGKGRINGDLCSSSPWCCSLCF
jgi:hypothetical protein